MLQGYLSTTSLRVPTRINKITTYYNILQHHNKLKLNRGYDLQSPTRKKHWPLKAAGGIFIFSVVFSWRQAHRISNHGSTAALRMMVFLSLSYGSFSMSWSCSRRVGAAAAMLKQPMCRLHSSASLHLDKPKTFFVTYPKERWVAPCCVSWFGASFCPFGPCVVEKNALLKCSWQAEGASGSMASKEIVPIP